MSLKRIVGRARDRLIGNAFERALRRARNSGTPRVLLYWNRGLGDIALGLVCLLYTSPSPRDGLLSRMPSSA